MDSSSTVMSSTQRHVKGGSSTFMLPKRAAAGHRNIVCRRHLSRLHVQASYDGQSSTGTSGSILEAFFYGRAFAETLNERLGAALDDLLAYASRMSAQQSEFFRDFQEEVEDRARREMVKEVDSGGASSAPLYQSTSAYSDAPIYRSNGKGFGSKPSVVIAAPPDLQETVDELRAEMASTRAAVLLYKSSLQQDSMGGNASTL